MMNQDPNIVRVREISSMDELSLIILPKSTLHWLSKSENFNELVTGCYVRILTKTEKLSLYTLYKIVETIDTDVPQGKTKYAKRIKVDNSNERVLESVEEDPMTQEEFDLWIQSMRQKNQKLPTIQEVRQRNADIQKAVEQSIKSSPIHSPDQLKLIILKRRDIVNMFLNQSIIPKGCFAFMFIQRLQLVEIIGIMSCVDRYEVKVKKDGDAFGFKLNLRLNVRLIRQAHDNIGVHQILDGPFDDEEIEEWMDAYEDAGLLPTTGFVEQKAEEIRRFLNTHKLPMPKREPKDSTAVGTSSSSHTGGIKRRECSRPVINELMLKPVKTEIEDDGEIDAKKLKMD